MAIITKIREKSGWAVAFIAVCLALFVVGTDIFGPNSRLFAEERIVGTIDGEDIQLEDFNQLVAVSERNFALQYNTQATEAQMPYIREQAWQQMVLDKAYTRQFEKLGITVNDDEVNDMIQGNNIHPSLVQGFTDPNTGQFDRNQVVQFLANFETLPVETQAAFANFEQGLYKERALQKYQNLFSLSEYASQVEAKESYKQDNTTASFRFVYIPYSSIKDDSVSVSESEIADYYSANKEDYEQEGTVSLEYVYFPINPTENDEVEIINELKELMAPFAETADDTAFVRANSDNLSETSLQTLYPDQLPPLVLSNGVELGRVDGPVKEGNTYKAFKIYDEIEDSVYAMRASHILVRTESKPDAEAKNEAQILLSRIKRGESFEEVSKSFYEKNDPNAPSDGDLGWFEEGKMLKPFNDKAMAARRLGVIPELVKTDFGYHIINVTATKTKKRYLLATLERNVVASSSTVDSVYVQAGTVAVATSGDEFKSIVDSSDNLIRLQANNISVDANSMNNITGNSARNIILWAHKEAEIGTVSRVFELDDAFVVATLVAKEEKGYTSLNRVKEDIKRTLAYALKREKILSKVSSFSGTIDEVANFYGSSARVNEINELKLSSNTLRGVGAAPELVAKAFTTQEGQTSEFLYDEDHGVIKVDMLKLSKPIELADYNSYRATVEQQRSRSLSSDITKAIEKLADVRKQIYMHF